MHQRAIGDGTLRATRCTNVQGAVSSAASSTRTTWRSCRDCLPFSHGDAAVDGDAGVHQTVGPHTRVDAPLRRTTTQRYWNLVKRNVHGHHVPTTDRWNVPGDRCERNPQSSVGPRNVQAAGQWAS